MLTPDDNSIKSRKDDYNQFMIAGGNQAPELEIQHEMNHFPSFPIGSSTPRVPREYSTRRTTSGFNYHQSVSSTTPTPFHQPSYSPTANILENLGVSGKSVSVDKLLPVFVLFLRGFE